MTDPKPRTGFPRTFWVANVMELFERGAYYGMNSVLAVYLSTKVDEGGLGFDKQSIGFLQSIVYAATYVVPILGGALADRYGYRRMLLVAFSLLASGYFAAGYMSTYGLVFLSLLVMATGAGLFKPIISGTIARTTNESNSAFGFGVYYWMINLGAFVAPLVVSVLKGFSWQYVFVASAAYTGLMLLPTLLVWTDPPRPPSTKTLKQVLVGAAEVLGDSRFMLMVVVYSGFWILYFQNFGSVLWYLGDFVDGKPVDEAVNGALRWLGFQGGFRFDAEHVTSINAGTIILLQVVVSRTVKNWKPLPTMVTGMALGACGFALLASSHGPWVFIAGIAVFSIGEMTAHPKYYSFIGIVAPADKKAVYMGYAFLYGVFGALLGSSLGGAAYEHYLKPVVGSPESLATTRTFWLVFAVLDVIAALGLVLYARIFGADTPATRNLARAVMAVVYAVILLLGGWFLYVAFAADPVQAKIAVQATIFLLLGAGGLFVSLRRPAAA
ncbi:MAG: peptide MFS transporter [Planctomycetes bacterium]|nr:peptide MFS transporter [Planctomycetota bacterium]